MKKKGKSELLRKGAGGRKQVSTLCCYLSTPEFGPALWLYIVFLFVYLGEGTVGCDGVYCVGAPFPPHPTCSSFHKQQDCIKLQYIFNNVCTLVFTFFVPL